MMSMDIPTVALPDGVLLTDGGMGQELRRRGSNNVHPIWSAQALIEMPDIVRETHRDYILAGARLIITNTYSTVRGRLKQASVPGTFEDLNRLAGQLAVEARDEVGENVLIAGSLPPLFGSYRPENVRPFDEIEPLYREQAELLAPYVDLFICETMSTAAEARAAATGAASTGKPVWVAWTIKDDQSKTLRSGETLTTAHAALAGLPVSGFLANCSYPESLSAAMPDLVALSDFPAGGYANGFQHIPEGWSGGEQGIEALGHREDLTPDAYADYALSWIKAGAKIVGGCCEVGPEHIQRLAEVLAETSP